MMYRMLVPILLFLSGCAEPQLPKFMTPEASASIQIGRSTMTDVQEAFGPPKSCEQSWRRILLSRPAGTSMLSGPRKNRTIVKVEFGPNQVVQKLVRIYEERRTPEARGIAVPVY